MQLSQDGTPTAPSTVPDFQASRSPTPEQAQYAGQLHLIPAICAAVGAGIIGLIVLIVMWNSRKHESEFIRHSGKEAMNFHISLIILGFAVTIVSLAVFIPVMVMSGSSGGKPGPEILIAPMLLMCMILPFSLGIIAVALVCGIRAYTATCRGEWHRYRYIVRFVS